MTITALPLNCTLKASGTSSTDAMLKLIGKALAKRGVAVAKPVRVAAMDIKPGVTSDEGDSDEWPRLRAAILDHDILILGGPIWLGQISSVAKRVLERMDAFLEETDKAGRMPSFGKVALAAVVGNEDGAHFCCAQTFQALNDVGFTIPAVAGCYWVGEAMGDTDFADLKKVPKQVRDTAAMVAANAAHLAGLLKSAEYPGS